MESLTDTDMSTSAQTPFASTIFEFVMGGGKFFAATPDTVFCDLLKSTLHQALGFSRKALTHCSSMADLEAFLAEGTCTKCVICLERMLSGLGIVHALEKIFMLCSDARVIVLTQEVDQYSLVLMVEQGAHNVIVKPISMISLTEKLAFTISPQGKLSRLIDAGKKNLERQLWGEALLVAEDILAQKPDSAAGFMIKGDAYKGLDMKSKAESMYVRATETAEMYLAPLKRLVELYERTGETEKQLSYLKKLNEISPLNTNRLLRIGELEVAAGNAHMAEEMFEKVLGLAKREAMDRLASLSSRIAGLCAENNPELAARYSKKSLELKKNQYTAEDIATVNVLGISLRKQGRWKEAVREYGRVLSVIPNHAGLLYNIALAYSEGGVTQKAYETLLQALAIDPRLPDSGKNIAFNIGMIIQKSGGNGTPYFKKAYEQDPNDPMLWGALKRSQAMHAGESGVSGETAASGV